ncbi:MAG: hypothetical protein Q7T50_08815 [Candidatus Magasanikbacteria bacterium]|nr:hypothetical protein [Candidatus Magasanikbacteria bacterium]
MNNLGKYTIEDYKLDSIDKKSPTNPDLSYENDFRKTIPPAVLERAKIQFCEHQSLVDQEAIKKWQIKNADTFGYIKEAEELIADMKIDEIFKMLDEKEPPIRSIDKYRLAAFCDLVAGTNETRH